MYLSIEFNVIPIKTGTLSEHFQVTQDNMTPQIKSFCSVEELDTGQHETATTLEFVSLVVDVVYNSAVL